MRVAESYASIPVCFFKHRYLSQSSVLDEDLIDVLVLSFLHIIRKLQRKGTTSSSKARCRYTRLAYEGVAFNASMLCLFILGQFTWVHKVRYSYKYLPKVGS